MEHCCKRLKYEEERSSLITYLPPIRSYVIETKYGELDIYFCPWCGSKLPEDLISELSEIIYEELNLDGYEDPSLPLEFKSDIWWRRRGL